MKYFNIFAAILFLFAASCQDRNKNTSNTPQSIQPKFTLTQTDTFRFNNFVDCNMAEAWVGDTFRIFPGKYGEDPVWGYARDLKFSSGRHADEAFSTAPSGSKRFIRIRAMPKAARFMPFTTMKTTLKPSLTTASAEKAT